MNISSRDFESIKAMFIKSSESHYKFEIPRGNYRVLKDIEVFNFKSLSKSPNKTPR